MNLTLQESDDECNEMIVVHPVCFPVVILPCVHIITPPAFRRETKFVKLYKEIEFTPRSWSNASDSSKFYENCNDNYEFYEQELRHGKCTSFDNIEGFGKIRVFGRKYNKKVYVE